MKKEIKKSSLTVGLIFCLVMLLEACGSQQDDVLPMDHFNPPKNLQVKRTYVMKDAGFKTGEMESIRKVDHTQSSLLIKDSIQSYVAITEDSYITTKETLWIGAEGVVKYQGHFVDSKTNDLTNMSFNLEGKTVYFESKTSNESKTYKQKFVKGKDFHTTTIYIDPTDRELKQGKEYKRKMLDVSFARTMNLTEKLLRMEKFTLDEYVFDCYVLYIDYGHLWGEAWLAKDDLGWFLVYEKAVTTEGSFELVMDSYVTTKKE